MSELTAIKTSLFEKQDLIATRLNLLNYNELLALVSSLSSLISKLDFLQADEEIRCNRVLIQEMNSNPRGTLGKAEAILRSSETYRSFKYINNLKNLAIRSFHLSKQHATYLLKLAESGDEI